MNNTILLVDDSPEIQFLVRRLLTTYNLLVTDDPDQVQTLLKANKVDLVLLDIMLPKRDGYSVLNELQSSPFSDIPVICLTGKTEVHDKVTAFNLGADDYIQKPIEPMEFRARVAAKLSRRQKLLGKQERLSIGQVKVDLSSHRAFNAKNVEILLTQTEFKLLMCLAKQPGQVFTREQLLTAVWGNDEAVFDRAVDVHVCALRKKMSDQGLQFKSVAGVGYKLLVDNTLSNAAI